jgi:uncharacterized protein
MHDLFTHNDLDGVGCGILARCAFGDKVDVRYNSVSSLNPQVQRYLERAGSKPKKGRLLFITDLSVDEANAKKLDHYTAQGGKARLLDHHKTALHLNSHSWACVQVEYEDGRLASATSLFYDYLVQHGLLEPRPVIAEFVELVRQYDTWEWEERGNASAKRLNDLFFLYSLDDFEERMVKRLLEAESFAYTEFEEKMLELEEGKIERYIRRKKRELVQSFIEDHCVGIVHAESYHSELSHALGYEFPHLDYIAILNMGGKKLSLRTIHDGVDVSEVAGRYGGGGHAKAAGCSLTEEAFRMYAVEPFPEEPIRFDTGKTEYNVKDSQYGVLYENREETQLYLFQAENRWHIDANEETLEDAFDTFGEAERFVKRQYAAWLAHDDAYIRYLMAHAGKKGG